MKMKETSSRCTTYNPKESQAATVLEAGEWISMNAKLAVFNKRYTTFWQGKERNNNSESDAQLMPFQDKGSICGYLAKKSNWST